MYVSLAAFWPHAYTLQLAETRNSGTGNSYSMRPTEIETVNIPEGHGHGHGGITLRDNSPILDNLESGRRL